MPLMPVFKSNRVERLAEILSAIVSRPLPSPFVPETIVVQSRAWSAGEVRIQARG